MRDKNWIRQRLGAILAIAVLALSVFDLPVSWGQPGLGAMNVFASSEQDSLWATASNAVYKKGASQDVDIYVIAEDNDVCPGNLSEMTLYLKIIQIAGLPRDHSPLTVLISGKGMGCSTGTG